MHRRKAESLDSEISILRLIVIIAALINHLLQCGIRVHPQFVWMLFEEVLQPYTNTTPNAQMKSVCR